MNIFEKFPDLLRISQEKSMICSIFVGGDATENGDFPIRKQRLQGTIFLNKFATLQSHVAARWWTRCGAVVDASARANLLRISQEKS